MINNKLDSGKEFDWGRTSADYAKFRDIYPKEFYEHITKRGLCVSGQNILDIGTGTGVIPRNMQKYGAKWTATDISENQIAQAKRLSEGMNIDYHVMPAEELDFPDNSFDVITAAQCFWYFDHERACGELARILKPGGRLVFLVMEWLPFEDKIAGASEDLVLKYSPEWSGAGETFHPIELPDCYFKDFKLSFHEEYYLQVPFTRETWNGRMKACRGVGASLSPEEIEKWEAEHLKLLNEIAPEQFNIKHYAAIAELEKL